MTRRYTGSTKPQPNVLNTVNDAAMTVPVTACNGNASSEKLGAGGSFMPPGWGSVDDCVASNERAPYRVVPASRMGRFTTNETQNVQKRCAPTRKAAEASETGGKLLPQRAGTTRGNDLGPLIADRGRSPFKSGLVGSGAWPSMGGFCGLLRRPRQRALSARSASHWFSSPVGRDASRPLPSLRPLVERIRPPGVLLQHVVVHPIVRPER